jgi:hypothetical protein
MLVTATDLYVGFPESEFVNLLRSPGIENQPGLAAGKTTLFDVPTRQDTWLAELIPWNRLLGSLNVYKFGLRHL